jgi:hypothetical protein
MTTTTLDSTTAELADRLAILELIGRLVLLLDARDWNALEDLFTDTVYNDRTSLTGGEPVTLGANSRSVRAPASSLWLASAITHGFASAARSCGCRKLQLDC